MKEKGEFQNGVSGKQRKPNFLENEQFLPRDTHT